MFIAWQLHYCITSYCLVGSCKVRENLVIVWLTMWISLPMNVFSDCFCLFDLFVSNRIIRISIIGSYMVEICPTTYSAATGPRASRVRPPRDCAPRSVRVLNACGWNYTVIPFVQYLNRFLQRLFFKGVGSQRVTMLVGCFIFEFLRVIATNLHSNICILHHVT